MIELLKENGLNINLSVSKALLLFDCQDFYLDEGLTKSEATQLVNELLKIVEGMVD